MERQTYKNCTGDVLMELMKAKNLTASQVARGSGVSVQLVCTWLNGQTPRGDWHIEAVARFLGVDMAFILYGIEESTRPKTA
jgi:transcriptional regulator with XRE-family HTH domain